jgi:hypothetical protein
MDIDDTKANKSTDEDFLSDKVLFCTYALVEPHLLNSC